MSDKDLVEAKVAAGMEVKVEVLGEVEVEVTVAVMEG